MTHDHRSTDLHRAELDHEIETIRTERLLAIGGGAHDSILARTRRAAGRALIGAGMALVGREAAALRTHRA
jgi:hypothetical protein